MNVFSFSCAAPVIAGWPARYRWLAALASGALIMPAMAPWSCWPFLFAGLSFYYIILSSAPSAKTAALYGGLHGFGYHLFGLYWIGNALLVEGNDFSWVWPLAIAGLPLLLGLFSAAAGAIIHLLAMRTGGMTRAAGFLIFIAGLSVFEWLRGHIFTGFPWNLYGYSWISVLPIAQFASIAGIYGLTLLTIFWAALPGFLLIQDGPRKQKALWIAFTALAFVSVYAYGYIRLAHAEQNYRDDLVIRLVQPNINQADKWLPEKAGENLGKLLSLSFPEPENQTNPTLIVWPETALSFRLMDMPSVREALRDVLGLYANDVYLATGLLRRDTQDNGETRYYNSLVVYDRNLTPVAIYDKSHLVPFGEYIPFQKWLTLTPFVKFSGFDAGDGPRTLSAGSLPPFSPLICYEIIFPGQAVYRGHSKPAFILNVTNDGWYGDSPGPYQHYVQSRFRAIEEGLPVVRSANTGISALTDSYGRSLVKMSLSTENSENISIPNNEFTTTPYAYLRDKLFWGSVLSICFVCVFLSRRNKCRGRTI
ncbi:MAG: apolipoprotein N-acyltransferase [Rhodospirillales bacterium]|nr:apolipoprotein N-acyltransferase [Rhodospirillales bacterium]